MNTTRRPNMLTGKTSRRAFLRGTTFAASAAWVAPFVVPARVLGADGTVAPSNRINMGFIGTGRQVFHANLPWHLQSEEVQVVAVCDVDSWRMEKAKAKVDEAYAAKAPSGAYKGCAAHHDFRELLARKDVDAVMISTPDHWHAYMAIEAAKAGKDTALEKPISLSVTEGRAIADAVKKHGRVFRTDTEVRAEERFLKLCQVVRNGRIGQVKRVLAGVPKDPPPLTQNPAPMPVPPELNYEMWQGAAPARPYTEQRVHYPKAGLDYSGKGPGWMHIRDYSLGVILNWGTHILDITQWALNTERSGPVEIEGRGEFPKDNLRDVLQQFEVRYRYESGIEVIYTNAGRPFVRVEGSEGWIENTWFQPDGFIASNDELLRWNPGPNDVKFPLITEKQDFVNCIKSRKETMIPAEIGHRTATMCQIGHISIETGSKLLWNPETERFVGNDEANKLLTRAHRAPWKVEG
ncbi:MAG: Gfo/Idh/MocA family oxidoreductase [Verrucomicrobia bacterium]|nr:Gfo/Idh/MocA family oxidoreductase [Verrucomicrobiota bacterium]